MTIIFHKNSWNEESFQIEGITYQTDEAGIPIDIGICGTEETLLQIQQYARVGFNMQPLEIWNSTLYNISYKEGLYECLCARLEPFEINN